MYKVLLRPPCLYCSGVPKTSLSLTLSHMARGLGRSSHCGALLYFECIFKIVHIPFGRYLAVRQTDILFPGHDLRPEDIGLVSAGGEEEKQPFMVAFLKASPANAKVRTTRDTGRRRLKKADVTATEPNLPKNPFGKSFSNYSISVVFFPSL